MMFIVT